VGYAAAKLLHAMLQGRPLPAGLKVQIPTPPVIERESTGGRAVRDADTEPAYHLIHRRACEGITINEVVQTTAVCRKTFTERFKAAYGRTPGEELRRVKLERAKHLLVTTGLAVTRIAALCGFGQPGKFYNFFKRETGCGPRQYRARHAPNGEGGTPASP
jgi:LacI family transcriptional regulator